MKDIKTVVDWLAGGATSAARSEDVLGQLCGRLLECGLPLWRVAVFVNTLHPDIMGRSFVWQVQIGGEGLGGAVRDDADRHLSG